MKRIRRRHGPFLRSILLAALLLIPTVEACRAEAANPVQFVIHISVDGLRSDAVVGLGPANLPHFYRMRVTGACTDDARTDFDFTVTLPDHACQLTARPVNGADGHGVTFNSDNGGTFESAHGSYVAGVFDVVHDHGLRTAMYAGKSKFAFFERSWNAVNGAPDTTGADDGRDKIDRCLYGSNAAALVDSFIADMTAEPVHYSFVHLADPDAVGHASGWCSGPYYDCVIDMDGLIGRIFDLIDADPDLKGKTAVILTADHGGEGFDHGDPTLPHDYTVPFVAWGPGIPAGADLYELNPVHRLDPGDGRPDQQAVPQPIRNGDVANLGLELLGLPPIPGSVINASQELDVEVPAGAALPAVSITAPEDGAVFDLSAPVVIEADASVVGDVISRVEFFADYAMIGEDDTTPFACTWNGAPLGRYRITARGRSGAGFCSASSIGIEVVGTASIDGDSRLEAPAGTIFPNPFSGTASVEFLLTGEAWVEMTAYDVRGRRAVVLFDRRFDAGRHAEPIDMARFSPGVYLYRFSVTREAPPGRAPGAQQAGAASKTASVSAGKLMILR